MTNLICPSCGANKVRVQQVEEIRQLTLGPEFSYTVPMHVCDSCGEEWDSAGLGDEFREKAYGIARKKLTDILIDDIQNNKGLKLSYIERAFELPQRTISSKWRSGISSSGLALLRIVSAMPWIVHIADGKFTQAAIGRELTKVLVDNGASLLVEEGLKNEIQIKVTRTETNFSAASIDTSRMFVSTGT